MPLKVTYYARVSTDKEEQLHSLDNQVTYFKEYIQSNKNWQYIDGYVDEGITGTAAKKRENFMRMIEDGKNKNFDLIVTKEVSRFSRDTIDSLLYTRKLLEYDVCVYFTSDNIITASNDGELRLTIMSSMAQDEVRKLSERTKFGFKRSIEKGRVLGTDNIWGYKKDNGKLVIDEEESKIVKDIFEVYANDEKIGLKNLSLYLKDKGMLNRNGNPIHQNTLKKIIQNPKYKGFYTGGLSTVVDYRSKKRNFNNPSEWKIYEDNIAVPPIVSKELWEKANRKLLERSKSASMYQKHQTKYALSGKIYCEKHKCGFVRKVKHYKTKGDIIRWICQDYNNTGRKNCPTPFVLEQDIFNILLNVFKSYEKYKDEISKELLSFYNEILFNEKTTNKEIELQNQIDSLLSKKEKLLDLALDGILSKEDLKSKNVLIENQLTDLKAKLEELQKQSVNKKNQKQYLNLLKKSILKDFAVNESNLEQYIEKFLDKIIVKDNEDKSELQIILNTKELININMSDKLRQLQNLSDKNSALRTKADIDNICSYSNTLKSASLFVREICLANFCAKYLYCRKFEELSYNIIKVPSCHSHAHSNHLFSRATTLFEESIHIKSNSRQIS